VYNLAIKVEKHLKGRTSFYTSLTRGPLTNKNIKTPPLQVRALNSGRESLVSHLRGWKERNDLSATLMDNFKSIVLIGRPLPLGE